MQASGVAEMIVVEAEVRVPIATAQLIRYNVPTLDFSFLDERSDHIDLCLTPRPRNTCARFQDRWSPQRFEKLGSVFLMPRGEAVQFRTDGGSQASIVCQLHAEAIGEWLQQSVDWTDGRIGGFLLDIPNSAVRTLLRRLADELRAPGFASQILVELITGQLVIELSRFCREIESAPETGGLSGWRLRRIDERLAEVREPPTLTELAAACGMSVRQLTRSFRASRGCSIGDYVDRFRIETAMRLLAGDESIKSIASRMGFSSPSHFSLAFRRATGMTPRGFRHGRGPKGHPGFAARS
ncbi:helix-turn-helix transcriptional regulator [Phenylobacterium sp. LjRoot225]|uniref:helix-turn-helix domain-containing protein n=1 Tax=Phenylobacterium sp. LjRoot225 TaxID=3342285 RepID=UPI003ECEF90F